MDKYRNNNPRRRHGNNIDGFISGGSQSSGSIDFRRGVAGRQTPVTSQAIGNFRRSEGFRPVGQPQLAVRPRQPRYRNQQPAANIRLDEIGVSPRRKTNKRRAGKVLMRGMATLIVGVLLCGGYLFGKGYLKVRHIFKGGTLSAAALQANVDPSLLRGEGDGRVNIMLLGKGGPGHDGADLTDTILIASIDPLSKEASLLSVPRDLYISTPNSGSMKINAVYATAKQKILNGRPSKDQAKNAEQAGLNAIQKTLEQTLGIPIHYYTMVDFEAFRQAIDTVGGVNINVQQRLYDPTVAWENNNNPLIAAVGQQNMNGKKALLYARSRHGSARGDFDRAERQRQILVALKEKVLTLNTFSNPVKISQLMDAFGSNNHVTTDLTLNDVMRLYALGKDIPSSKVASIGLADPPNDYVTTSYIANQSVVVPKAGLNNYTDIQKYVRNTLKDGFIRNENASIVILNGTAKAGLATAKAQELKSFGYNVTRIEDAPSQDYAKTVLVDLRAGSKKYTRHYLEGRFGVSAVTKLPDGSIQAGNADLVIVLGRNAY